MKPTRLAPLSTEFSNSRLGDERLKKRLMCIVDAAEKAPSASLPVQAGSSAALEGTYRFIENDRVSSEAVLDAHVQCTVERARTHPYVYVVHDTTKFKFGGEKHREGLGWLHSHNSQGFLSHFSICVSPTGEPLGTLGLYAWHRQGKFKGHRRQQESQSDPERESMRWIDSSLLAGELLFNKTEAIHLMDREGDSYELFAFLLENAQRFVIRLSHDRRREPGRAAPTIPKLFETLSNSSFYFDREVILSARGKNRSGALKRSFPPRASRQAHLEVRATSQDVFIGNGAPTHLPPSLRLNFVEVRESRPPADEEPIVWRLVTTEPIDTKEQVAAIVDAYRQRWIIEEFFKALKTGCRYQEHQLGSSHTLLILLAIETAVAWRMLLVRWMAQNEPDAPGEKILNSTQLMLLTELAKEKKRKIPMEMTASYVLYEIAALGGHIKNNGPPGWLVLRRGFDELLSIERGWTLANAAINIKKDAINH